MKKILFSLCAIAAIAACTKSEVQYEPSGEISFAPVSKLNTKAAVDGTDYPDALNMFVFANAGLDGNDDNSAVDAAECTEVYFANAEFTHTQRTDITLADNVFAGVTPYYWPNVKSLIFSGVSKSGNINASTNGTTPTYDGTSISIEGYMPGNGTSIVGDNDLMWFPTTVPYAKPGTIGSDNDKDVNVKMQHACAWVTIILKGNSITANDTTPWKVENVTVVNLSQKADVDLGTVAAWKNLSETKNLELLNLNTTTKKYEGLSLTTGGQDYTDKSTVADSKVYNLIVIPQTVKDLEVSYNFISQKGADENSHIVIDETLPIDMTPTDAPTTWDAGKHYTYTITFTAEEILVEPTATDWVEHDNDKTTTPVDPIPVSAN